MSTAICKLSKTAFFLDIDTGKLFTYDNSYCDTYTDYETTFILPILETGWIYDVHLLTDGKNIDAFHLRRAFRYYYKDEIYSFFMATYIFPHSYKCMEAQWSYYINGIQYFTEPIFFSVEEFYDRYFDP